jgi:hypothetical protein
VRPDVTRIVIICIVIICIVNGTATGIVACISIMRDRDRRRNDGRSQPGGVSRR